MTLEFPREKRNVVHCHDLEGWITEQIGKEYNVVKGVQNWERGQNSYLDVTVPSEDYESTGANPDEDDDEWKYDYKAKVENWLASDKKTWEFSDTEYPHVGMVLDYLYEQGKISDKEFLLLIWW